MAGASKPFHAGRHSLAQKFHLRKSNPDHIQHTATTQYYSIFYSEWQIYAIETLRI